MKKIVTVILYLFITVVCFTYVNAQEINDIRTLFEKKYEEYKNTRPMIFKSFIDKEYYNDIESYNEIVQMGMPIVPYIMEYSINDSTLLEALRRITKWEYKLIVKLNSNKQFISYLEDFNFSRDGFASIREVWDYLLGIGHEEIMVVFENSYNQWKKNINNKEGKHYYRKIKDLGVIVLPMLIDKVKKEDYEVLPILSYLTNNAMSKEELEKHNNKEKVKMWLKWWKKNHKNYEINKQ